jgi:hypothetical protein
MSKLSALICVTGLLGLSACTVEVDDNGGFGPGDTGVESDGGDGDGGGSGPGDGGNTDGGDGDSGGDGDGDGGDGDGDGGEDDGGGNPNTCGDGVVDQGEDCDDSGESATCNDDCTVAACGDGKFNYSAGEDCDGLGDIDNGTCSDQCAWECFDEYGDCNDDTFEDGCETWLLVDEHCGGCGNACGNGQSCVVGACEITNSHGNDQEYDKGNIALPNYLLGNKISVSSGGKLTHLNMFSKQAGPKGQFALYEDVGGNPGPLVVSTDEIEMELGMMQIPVGNSIDIAAGDYWMLGVFDGNASIGLDTSDGNVVVKYADLQFGNAIPDPFGQAQTYNGQSLNYFVTVMP